jgi:hypothetical protein
MRHWVAVGIVSLTTGCLSSATNPPDPLAARKRGWQKGLEGMPFNFSERHAGVPFSLIQYGGDCKVHMTYDPKKPAGLRFRFERGGKEVLALEGHMGSVFFTDKNVLYFAHLPAASSGCTVAAYDLTTGKELWATRLSAVGDPDHSAYSNRVNMWLSSVPDLDKDGEGVVIITGRESYGDYAEVLDRGSGKVLAHRIYRQGFGSSK